MYSGYDFDDPVVGTLKIVVKKATESDHGTDLGWSTSFGDGQAEFTSQLRFSVFQCNY